MSFRWGGSMTSSDSEIFGSKIWTAERSTPNPGESWENVGLPSERDDDEEDPGR